LRTIDDVDYATLEWAIGTTTADCTASLSTSRPRKHEAAYYAHARPAGDASIMKVGIKPETVQKAAVSSFSAGLS